MAHPDLGRFGQVLVELLSLAIPYQPMAFRACTSQRVVRQWKRLDRFVRAEESQSGARGRRVGPYGGRLGRKLVRPASMYSSYPIAASKFLERLELPQGKDLDEWQEDCNPCR